MGSRCDFIVFILLMNNNKSCIKDLMKQSDEFMGIDLRFENIRVISCDREQCKTPRPKSPDRVKKGDQNSNIVIIRDKKSLINAPIDETNLIWEYVDSYGNIYGPFSSKSMREWLDIDYITQYTPIRRIDGKASFMPIMDVFKDVTQAFLKNSRTPIQTQVNSTMEIKFNVSKKGQIEEEDIEDLSEANLFGDHKISFEELLSFSYLPNPRN